MTKVLGARETRYSMVVPTWDNPPRGRLSAPDAAALALSADTVPLWMLGRVKFDFKYSHLNLVNNNGDHLNVEHVATCPMGGGERIYTRKELTMRYVAAHPEVQRDTAMIAFLAYVKRFDALSSDEAKEAALIMVHDQANFGGWGARCQCHPSQSSMWSSRLGSLKAGVLGDPVVDSSVERVIELELAAQIASAADSIGAIDNYLDHYSVQRFKLYANSTWEQGVQRIDHDIRETDQETDGGWQRLHCPVYPWMREALLEALRRAQAPQPAETAVVSSRVLRVNATPVRGALDLQ